MTALGSLAHARLLADTERWGDALRALAPVIATEPDQPAAYCLAAQCQLGLGDPAASLVAAQAALGRDPGSEWAHRLASLSLVRLHRYAEARHHADQAVRVAPLAWQSHRQRAEVDLEAGHVDPRTWEAALRAVELGPDRAATHMTLGQLSLIARDNAAAAQAFERALALDPDNAAARNNLAVAQIRRRNFRAAAANFVGALRLEPTSALFAANLRLTLRAWALLLTVVGAVGCLVASANLEDRLVPTYVPVTGRPAVLAAVAGVLVAALVGVAAVLRHAMGPSAARIVRASMTQDPLLALTLVTAVVGVAAVVIAFGVGMPAARTIVDVTFWYDVVAMLVMRLLRRQQVRRGG